MVNVGHYTFRTDFNDSDLYREVRNGEDEDNCLLQSANHTSSVPVNALSWQLADSSHTALSDDYCPANPPDPGDWTQRFGLVIEGPGGSYFTRAKVDSVQCVF